MYLVVRITQVQYHCVLADCRNTWLRQAWREKSNLDSTWLSLGRVFPVSVLCWLQASFRGMPKNLVFRRPADCRAWSQGKCFGPRRRPAKFICRNHCRGKQTGRLHVEFFVRFSTDFEGKPRN